MADVISIDRKLQMTKEKHAELIRQRKIQAVQKVFQCTHCSFKCEKCGTQVRRDPHGEAREFPKVPYQFCETCTEEYLDYIARLQGRGDSDCYWRNESWLKIWRAWIDYQGAIDRYMKTKEFKNLVNELKQPSPDK